MTGAMVLTAEYSISKINLTVDLVLFTSGVKRKQPLEKKNEESH
ncbi:MAG: hypothetical protein VX438_18300 [Planctomycetota bacterium]|nr:hypothetical protein [Planctomycetota bacterium]